MATVEGWRLVRRPDYSSNNPEVEGAVLTPPGTSVTEPCWVWSDFLKLALDCMWISRRDAPIGDGFDAYATQPLLAVEWDEADVIETVDIGPSMSIGRHSPRPQFRYLVSACEVGDEFSLQEAALLCGLTTVPPPPHSTQPFPLWHPGDSVGFGDTDARPGYYDGIEPGKIQSGRRILVAAGSSFPATVGSEVGFMQALIFPPDYRDILAAHGRVDPFA